MPKGSKMSSATASGDTTRTSIGTVTLPANVKKITGIAAYGAAAGAMTTAEAITGKVDFSFSGVENGPPNFEIPLVGVSALTSGAVSIPNEVYPTGDLGKVANAVIEGFVTMDMAQTGALKCRFTVFFEY